ncbi:MAG TPA: chemotaxis protein CheW [Stenomitos sp.]
MLAAQTKAAQAKAAQAKVAMQKVLIFSVGALHLAVRLEGVSKVIPMPQILKSGDKFLGLTQLDGQDVIVLDLGQYVYGQAAQTSQGFLITVQTERNRYGLTAATLPIMRQMPVSDFQAVPSDYRDRDVLGVADAMVSAVLDNKEAVTAFVLDPERLLSLIAQGSPA